MKVPNDEEISNHIVAESCAAYREVRREALTGVHIGQPLVRQESWRGPVGESSVQVRGSAGLVASVASCSVTATAKRTQRSCG